MAAEMFPGEVLFKIYQEFIGRLTFGKLTAEWKIHQPIKWQKMRKEKMNLNNFNEKKTVFSKFQ